MKKFLFSITLIFPTLLFSQIFNPVQWEFSKEDLGNSEYDLFFTATIDDGWYLYSQYVEEDGPLPTSFTFYESDKYEIYDEEDEWNVILFVDKTEDINNFTDFLKERLGMSGNDVYDIIHEIWDNGHDTLGEMLDEETTDKIMLESENYILGK